MPEKIRAPLACRAVFSLQNPFQNARFSYYPNSRILLVFSSDLGKNQRSDLKICFKMLVSRCNRSFIAYCRLFIAYTVILCTILIISEDRRVFGAGRACFYTFFSIKLFIFTNKCVIIIDECVNLYIIFDLSEVLYDKRKKDQTF